MEKTKLLNGNGDYYPLVGLLETLDRFGIVEYCGVVTVDHQSGESALMFEEYMIGIDDEK